MVWLRDEIHDRFTAGLLKKKKKENKLQQKRPIYFTSAVSGMVRISDVKMDHILGIKQELIARGFKDFHKFKQNITNYKKQLKEIISKKEKVKVEDVKHFRILSKYDWEGVGILKALKNASDDDEE